MFKDQTDAGTGLARRPAPADGRASLTIFGRSLSNSLVSGAKVPVVLRSSVRMAALLALGITAAASTACLPSLLFHKYGKASPMHGHVIPDVPFEKWLARNYCGPACLSMVLNYWGGGVSQPEIA